MNIANSGGGEVEYVSLPYYLLTDVATFTLFSLERHEITYNH
jgi:hypothetical protein